MFEDVPVLFVHRSNEEIEIESLVVRKGHFPFSHLSDSKSPHTALMSYGNDTIVLLLVSGIHLLTPTDTRLL